MPYCNNPGVPVTINIFTKLQEILKTPPPQELKACEANCSAAMLEIEANYLVTMLEIPVRWHRLHGNNFSGQLRHSGYSGHQPVQRCRFGHSTCT